MDFSNITHIKRINLVYSENAVNELLSNEWILISCDSDYAVVGATDKVFNRFDIPYTEIR